MTRDQAVDIAMKFGVRFPGLQVNASQGYQGDWGVRIVLPSTLETWAYTPEGARRLWAKMPGLLEF